MTRVRVTNPTRTNYLGRSGVVVKNATRDGLPYLGVQFEGVEHVVWFFEWEVQDA